jgi:hypothetical protein
MRELIGPFWLINRNSPAQWGYIHLEGSTRTCYLWHNDFWHQIDWELGDIIYTFFPVQQTYIAWVNAAEGLIKAPLTQSKESSHYYLSAVFKPAFLENEVRWVPVHMKRAHDFDVFVDEFPLILSSEQHPIFNNTPNLPTFTESVSSPTSSMFFHSAEPLPTIIEAQQSVHSARLSKLSLAQRSFVVQCIKANDHWPIECKEALSPYTIHVLVQNITEIHGIIPIASLLQPLPKIAFGWLIDELRIGTRWIFQIHSLADLKNLFENTPQTYHRYLINLFSNEIDSLNRAQSIDLLVFQPMLETKAYKELKAIVRHSWDKAKKALIDSITNKENAVPKSQADNINFNSNQPI